MLLSIDEVAPQVGHVLERAGVANVQRVGGVQGDRPGEDYVIRIEVRAIGEFHAFAEVANIGGQILIRIAGGSQARNNLGTGNLVAQ